MLFLAIYPCAPLMCCCMLLVAQVKGMTVRSSQFEDADTAKSLDRLVPKYLPQVRGSGLSTSCA